ncbi:MAG: TraR/DksA C4-type zinc finger protein [Nitrospirae bacterium]|nr:TraR/DksA C4-type zinc finger protein [Nitrospirota bacterium]
MTKKRKDALKMLLIKKREAIVKEARQEIEKFVSGADRQLVETALDNGDWSIIDLSKDINLSRLSTHKENLTKMDESLRKLAEGTYGVCEDCGTEINEKRLKALPFAIYCRDCQEKKEKLEEVEREEGWG